MTGIIVGTLIVCLISGIVIYIMTMPKPPQRDVFSDFKLIKKALVAYHQKNAAKCTEMKLLKIYLGQDASHLIHHYSLSSDEKFVIVPTSMNKENRESLLEKVGGQSFYSEEEKTLYLALLAFKISKIDPVAVITYFPKDGISTTTNIEWSAKDSKVDDKEIKQEEWVNKKTRYEKDGFQTISLRVQDKSDNWSEWVSVEIQVIEEKGIKSITAGLSHFFRLSLAGSVEALGKNKYGQLGDGNLADFEYFKRLQFFDNVSQIAAGDAHTLFRLYDGSAFACGSNDYGQLGNGGRNNAKAPQKIWGLEHVKQLVAGPDYSLAVLMSGAVMAWGNNEFGQLGEDKLPYRELPKRVKDVSKVKQASASSSHVACVLHDGTVIGWGDNSQGQLGAGFKGKQSEPILSLVASAFYVAVGKNFTIVVLDNGKVKAFGHNNFYQLGMVAENSVMFPKEIPDLKGIVKAVAYDSFVVAMSDIGEVYTWGRYSAKDGEMYMKPQKIHGLKYVRDIACSSTRGYALCDDGRVARWSGNLDDVDYLDDLSKHIN